MHRRATRVVTQRSEGDFAHATTTVSSDGRRRSRRRNEAALGEVRGVRETRGVTDHDADAGTAFVPGTELLDATLVQHRRGRRAVLDEDFGEFATPTHRFAQGALENVVINQSRSHPSERTRANVGRYATSRRRK
jgi:hypothetical protein